jgi:hypothetical protein
MLGGLKEPASVSAKIVYIVQNLSTGPIAYLVRRTLYNEGCN